MRKFKSNFCFFLILLCVASTPTWVMAMTMPQGMARGMEGLATSLKQELSKTYPGAQIDISGDYRWIRGLQSITDSANFPIAQTMIYGDDGKGNVHFAARLANDITIEGWVGFSAWLSVKMPIRRILPGERLKPEFFKSATMNFSSGPAHDLRGVLLEEQADVSLLEASQTLIEGQPLLLSAVKRVPDIRKGDLVRIHMISENLTLSTQGIASEPGYRNSPIKALTAKTKREVTGTLREDGVIEVAL